LKLKNMVLVIWLKHHKMGKKYIDSHSKFVIGTQYMMIIQDDKFIWGIFFFKNFMRLITKDFWMIKIWLYFHKSIWVAIFVCFSNFLSQFFFGESFTWATIHMDFMGFLFRTSKFKNDINCIKYKFSHRFVNQLMSQP